MEIKDSFIPFQNSKWHFSLEPIKVFGENNFGIMGIKQFTVTEDFLSLDMDVKNCQTETSVEDCITAKYLGKFHVEWSYVNLNALNIAKLIQLFSIMWDI